MIRFNSVSNFLILCLLQFSTTNFIFSQQEQGQPEFRKFEQLAWQEKITASQQISTRDYFDVLFYDLDVEIKINSPYIKGKVTCKFKTNENNTNFIVLDLNSALSVDSIKGDASSFQVMGDSIKVQLNHTFNSTEVGEVEVFYQGVPQLAGGYKGLRYETHGNGEPIIATLSTPFLAHYWWPCKDGPSDKADSVYIDITIPDTTVDGIPLIAVSNGTLENVISENGYKTFQWRERYPIVTYYVMAAISNYRSFQQIYESDSGTTFPIDYYVFDEHLSAAESGVEKMPEAMQVLSNYFGEYPFRNEKYGMTQLGYYGAIENQTNTITNNMSEGWLSTSVHELAHMWFGDMITCKSWHHGWLNEGFATYAEALWAEYQGGEEAYKSAVASFEFYNPGTLYLQEDSDPFSIFVSIIYNKGAYVLHMLRGVLGDELFFESLKQYATNPELKYAYAETEDFQEICEDVSGKNLDYFFDQWIYQEGYPRYNFGWDVEEVNDIYVVELHVEQIQTLGPIFKMPIELGISYKDGSEEKIVVWDSTQSQSFQLSLQKEPQKITLDPDNWILKKVQEVFYDPPLDDGILLVNGMSWSEEVRESYEQKAFWGDYGFTFWDLKQTPENGYPAALPVPIGSGDLGIETLKNYSTILWISDGKDYNQFNKNIMKNYLEAGGNIFLMTSAGRNFLGNDLVDYVGIEWSSSTLAKLQDFRSVNSQLTNISLIADQVFINTFKTNLTSTSAELLYQAEEGFDTPKGVGVISRPEGKGDFVLFTCKPYLLNNTDLASNVEYILQNFLHEPITSINDNKELIKEFIVNSLYPNPFNPTTTLEFYLPFSNQVSIEVYNIIGERLDVIFNSKLNSGWHNYKWQPSNLSSGVYFIRISAGEFNTTKKTILLK